MIWTTAKEWWIGCDFYAALLIFYAYQFQVIFQRVPLAQSPRCFHAVGIKRFFPFWPSIWITQTQNKIIDGADNDYLGSKAYVGYGWFLIINRFFRLNADNWEWWDVRVIYNHKPDTEGCFESQMPLNTNRGAVKKTYRWFWNNATAVINWTLFKRKSLLLFRNILCSKSRITIFKRRSWGLALKNKTFSLENTAKVRRES